MRYFYSVALLLVFILSASCVPKTALIQKDAEGKIFWPGPPEKERIKYLWSVSVVEVMGKGGRRGVLDFLAGDFEGDITDPGTSNTLHRPFGLFVDDKQNLYITDTGAFRVTIINLKDLKSRQIMDAGKEEFQMPVGVVADGKGKIFISDSVLKKVFIFNGKGKYMNEVKGDFLRPTGLAIDNVRGRLYISDTMAHKIYVYSTNGVVIDEIGGQGIEHGEFNFPTHLWTDRDGYLYVTDSMNFRVQIFNPDGEFERTFGTLGDAYSDLEKPKGVATDSDGHIYVVDSINDMIKIYNREGLLLLFFGEEGVDYGQLWLPSGIFIDNDDVIYVADTYNMRVQAFQYLKNN